MKTEATWLANLENLFQVLNTPKEKRLKNLDEELRGLSLCKWKII